jgi:hypothetical protein
LQKSSILLVILLSFKDFSRRLTGNKENAADEVVVLSTKEDIVAALAKYPDHQERRTWYSSC